MTIEFTDGTNHDGLFDLLGKAFHAQSRINTSRGTNAPADFVAIMDSFQLLPAAVDLQGISDPILPSLSAYQQSAAGPMATVQNYCRNLLLAIVARDATLIPKNVDSSLAELVRQMKAASQSVDASTVEASVSADVGNLGDGKIIVTTKGGDAVSRELLIPETITVLAANSTQLNCYGEAATPDRLSHDWPSGSGIRKSLAGVTLSKSLLANGGMETDSGTANVPDNWTLSVGTPGTHLSLTVVAQQTIVISGTPASGEYLIVDTKSDGSTQATAALPYNATSSQVQTAIRRLTGNEAITVSSTGTSPNLTHTVVFNGRGGTVPILSSISRLNTGSIAHNTTVAGTPQVFTGGKALKLASDGSNLTTIQQQVRLSPLTVYGFSLWAIADTVPAAGVVTIDLVDGIGGTVLQDAAGTNQSITFNATALSNSSWKHLTELSAGECVFRTPEQLPEVIYLRIRISTAVTTSRSIFVDQITLAALTELYSGGPLAGFFPGSEDVQSGDKWEIATTNDRAGAIQEWFGRNFDMSRLGLVLPSNNAGSETIPDSLIA